MAGLTGLPFDELAVQLQAMHIGCECHPVDLAAGDPDPIDPEAIARMVERIWKDKGALPGTVDKDVLAEFARHLWKGVVEGYGSDLIGADFTTPDFNMLAQLQRDVWNFSGAKNYTQLRQLTGALLNEEGQLRSRDEFIKAALKINSDQDIRFLKTEYDLAVAGSQMAGKWVSIQQQQETFTMLQFEAVLDGRTTELCRSLHGTVLPVDHPFWRRFYPPNHFNCRSTVRQLRGYERTITPESKIPTADIPAMFRTNLGQRGLIFPPEHPYFKDIPEGVVQQTMAAFRKEMIQTARLRLEGTSVQVPGLGKVEITYQSIKEMINQPHNEYMFKNQLVTISDSLLKKARLIKSIPDTKGKEAMFHYLRVDGLSDQYILVVRELFTGKRVLYSIIDKMK